MKKFLKPILYILTGFFIVSTTYAATVVYNSAVSNVAPQSIAGLKMWLKADAIVANDGDTISTWTDSSGNGNHMVSNNGPLYKTNVLNGKAVLDFIPSQTLLNSNLNLPSTWTVMYVTRLRPGVHERSLQGVHNNWLLGTWGNTVNSAYFGDYTHLFGDAADESWHLYEGTSDGTIAKLYGNGRLIATSTTAKAPPQGLGFNLGAYLNETSNMQVAEVVAYDTALSEEDRLSLEKYFKTKYGLTLARSFGTQKTVINTDVSKTDGLVGYWKLNATDLDVGNVHDYSSAHNNGTIVGVPTLVDRGSKKAFNFSNGSHVVVNGFSGLGTSSMTISGWVKPSPNPTLRSYFGVRDNNEDFYMLELYGNELECRLSIGTNHTDVIPHPATISNEWQFVAFVYDGSSTHCYVNDTVASTSASGTFSGTSAFYIGSNYQDMHMEGAISDVRAYNRALSAEEIHQLRVGPTTIVNASKDNRMKDGVVAHWSFDGATIDWNESGLGTAIDSNQQFHAGSLINMTQRGSPVPGKIGQALKFNGVNQYITVPDSSDLHTSSTTVCAWFKVEQRPTSFSTIVAKPYAAGVWSQPYVSWMIRFNSASDMEFAIGDGTTYKYLNYTDPVSIKKWNFTCLSYNGIDLKAYMNGILVGTNSYSYAPIGYSNGEIVIGADYSQQPYGSYFPGSIDDVRVYDRTLTEIEISRLFKIGK